MRSFDSLNKKKEGFDSLNEKEGGSEMSLKLSSSTEEKRADNKKSKETDTEAEIKLN